MLIEYNNRVKNATQLNKNYVPYLATITRNSYCTKQNIINYLKICKSHIECAQNGMELKKASKWVRLFFGILTALNRWFYNTKLSLNLSAPKYKINWNAQRTPFLSGIAIKWRRNGNIDGKSQLKIRFCPENGKSDCVPCGKSSKFGRNL